MRKKLGVFSAAVLYYSGLVGLSRRLMQRSGQRLIILNYHRASSGNLERHLLYLRQHYRMLHLEEALEELYNPAKAKHLQDQRTPLVLTFDDGYHDNYTHAFALACKLQVPITIFLIPGYIESGDYFWWREGRRLTQQAGVAEITVEGRTYHLDRLDERNALSQLIDHRLRYAGSIAERESTLAEFRRLLAVSSAASPEAGEYRSITWEEIDEMHRSGWVSFGAHTMHHPVLAHLTDAAEVQREVEECRRVLEQRLGHPVRTFAYPIGRAEHIGEKAVRAVKVAGYRWAVTTMQGVNTPESDPHLLRRVLGDASRHWLVMAAETSGIWHVFAPLWKKALDRKEKKFPGRKGPILEEPGCIYMSGRVS